MKNLQKYLVVILCLAFVFIFAGCNMIKSNTSSQGNQSNGNGGGTGGGAVNPPTKNIEVVPTEFKQAYRYKTADDSVANDISDLANALVSSFVNTFGVGCGYDQNSTDYIYHCINFEDEKYFYFDSIKGTIYKKFNEVEGTDFVYYELNTSWGWTIKNGTPFFLVYNKTGCGFDLFVYDAKKICDNINDEDRENYQNYYKNIYKPCMEVVLYEILLGNTDYQNMIKVEGYNADNYPKITYRGQTVDYNNGEIDLSGAIADLKDEYFDKASYFGISDNDAEKIKYYIMEYIIGSNAYNADGGQKTQNRNYQAYVDNLIKTEIADNDDYKKYARNRFEDGQLSVPETGDYFSLVDKAEYQSLVIMAEDADEFSSCWIAFQSDRDLKINMYLRYYDGQQIKTTTPKLMDVKAGKFDLNKHNTSYFEFGAGGNLVIEKFDNNDTIKADSVKTNSKSTNIYKTVDSLNGFGGVSVLNEENVNSSFVEIVLDVVKSPNDKVGTDYSFQVAMFGLYMKSTIEE